jgi:hypothetical protein
VVGQTPWCAAALAPVFDLYLTGLIDLEELRR